MYDGSLNEPQVSATINEVLRAVARASDITADDLRCKSRKREFSNPRQIAAYLCRELTDRSYPQISAQMGARHHTTSMFSHRKISGMLADGRPGMAAMLSGLTATIMAEARVRHAREQRLRLAVPASAPLAKKLFEDKAGAARWTVAQINELKRLHALHAPRRQMAEQLQRSLCSIEHKINSLRLAKRRASDRKDITAWMEQAA